MKGVPLTPLLILVALATARAQGDPPYLTRIPTERAFEQVSIAPPGAPEVLRTTKYLVPVDPASLEVRHPDLRAPLFQDLHRHLLHREFLIAEFPEDFPALGEAEYRALVERRATRRLFAGSISRLSTPPGELYGFTVFFDFADLDEALLAEEVAAVFRDVAAAFELRPLVYAPANPQARLAARDWTDPGFPVYLGGGEETGYQAYTVATGYGRVRILTLDAFERANETGGFSWQDILVLDRPPRDIEGVVAGIITAEEQVAFSHLAVRTARRGSPNAYVRDAVGRFRPLDGALVRLEVERTAYTAEPADIQEAEAWWRENRPRLHETPRVDPEHGELESLEAIDLESDPPPEARFGGKAANFARLQRILAGDLAEYRERSFGIPVRYYLEFLRANRIPDAPGSPTYEEHIAGLLASAEFQSDSALRFQELERFREYARDHGRVPGELVERIASRIVDVFGSDRTMVRFRSSSNVEDILEFNGAGLYESTSGCAADSLDSDNRGPSLCDLENDSERSIERALKKVWASLWTFRAFEERAWYQIPQDAAAMGVLVTRAFLDERANGVAFTGNPSNPRDRRYVVIAQPGEASVVAPEPGVRAETSVLEVTGGTVTGIDRVQSSSLVPPGAHVLSDADLIELGRLLLAIGERFPVATGKHPRERVLFDIEFKLEADGSLAVKQVRPFLVSGVASPPSPEFILEVPPRAIVCGGFADGRSPAEEYAVKSQLRLRAGAHVLPTGIESFRADLVEEVRFGPTRERLAPLDAGRVRVRVFAAGDGRTAYSFSYQQGFRLADGEVYTLDLELPPLQAEDGVPVEEALTIDEEFLSRRLNLLGVPAGDRSRLVVYGSCTHESLPLWDIRAALSDGTSLRLEERFEEPIAGSSPAVLAGATVVIGGTRREVQDYWDLVYAAEHHNEGVKYWVLLEPPIDVAGVGAVRAVELREPLETPPVPARASYLGPDLEVLARPEVVSYWRGLWGEEPSSGFRRGDVDGSGEIVLTDAVAILLHLFQEGPALACPDAADFDDDGEVVLTDAVAVLLFLFRGIDLSMPPGPYECGPDPTADFLGECRGEACRKG